MASFDGKMTRARKAKDAEVSKVHLKTFTAWINASLRKRGLEVKDLEKDLADGTVLIALVECLTDRPFDKKIHPRPVTVQAHQIENVALALEFMKPYTNLDIEAKDIVDGKTKVLLGLVWRLILNFQVMEVTEDKSKSTAAERNAEAKSKLLKWLTEQTAVYDEVAVTDVTESFSDGLAFCALIHRYNPTLLDWEKVQKMEPVQRLALAFKIADDELGIPQLLDPADVTAADPTQRPDEQCYMTYLSEFPRAFLAQLQDEVGRVDGVSDTAFVTSSAALKTSVKERLAAEDPRVQQAQLEAKQRALAEEEKRVAAAHAEAKAALEAAQERAAEGQAARHAAEAQSAQLAAQLAAQAEAAQRAAAHAEAQEAAKRTEAQAAQAVAAEAARRAEAEARQRLAAETQAAHLATQLAAQADAARRAEAGAQGEAQRAAQSAQAAEAARKAEAEAAARAAQMAGELERIRRENEALRAHLQQISANTLGKVRVVVLGARGLPGTDLFTGKADPYVTLTLERQKEKTKTLKRTNDPRWDAAYTFYVSEANAELVVTVWDWERLSKDNFLGHVVLPVKSMTPNVEKEEWYPLQPKKDRGGIKVKGEIHLRIVLQK